MLNKRTNILFDQEMWTMLVSLAKEEDTSVGNLVRNAVAKNYMKKSKLLKRKQAIDEILKIRKIIKGKINYKALIEDGRKY